MYDDLSSDYDHFVDWQGRLAAELPFVERQLASVQTHRVLDAACGTGKHAIALAERGYEVVGTDLSVGMIERARANAATARMDVRFEVVGFGELGGMGLGTFDAVICLGNSLPHLLTPRDLAAALLDFATCLRPEGLLLIQNRNFDAVLANRQRWMEPQSYQEGESEWIFLRFYDFGSDGSDGVLTFNMVTLQREGKDVWKQKVISTRLWPLGRRGLTAAIEAAGFHGVTCWGDMQGAPFDLGHSPNLVVTARAG